MNNIHNKYNNDLREIIISLIIISTAIIACLFEKANIIFVLNILITLLIVVKSKFSYFTMKTIIINYILIPVFFQYTTGNSYGILEHSSIKLHYLEINTLILIYDVITYLWVSYTNVLEKESELLKSNIYIGKISVLFCCAVAITTSIIAFPGLPFNKEYVSDRFSGLLPGSAWNHIAMVALLFLLPSFKKSNLVKMTYAFVIFWFLSHYERVDIIGLLLLCIIYVLARRNKIKLKTYIVIGLIVITILLTMVYVGEARVKNNNSITIKEVFRKTLIQNTASDIGYVFNSSIEYAENEELLKGKTYITYILKLVPLVDSKLTCDKILNAKYLAPGGEFILSEPIMNFGFIGAIIFQIIEFAIYTLILSNKTKYRFFVYSFLMMTVFRTTWYGWVYIEKAIVYFIPIIYIITKYLDEFGKNRNKQNCKSNGKENKIKVLLYSERWTSGGIESFIMNLYRNLDREKIEADILTSQDESDIYDEEIKKIGGNKYVTLEKKYNSPIIRTLKNLIQFKKTIKNKEYDIIHLNICHGVAMIYSYIAKKNGIRFVIVHSHNTDIGQKQKKLKKLGHDICKILFEKYADEYFACSDLAAKWLFTPKLLKSGKVKIINNAIDVDRFIFNEEERKKVRNELNVDDKFVIGNIGRFSEQKNHGFLIDIFKEINNKNKNSVLLLVGEGELRQEIEDKVYELGLKENVIFYGLAKDVPKLLWAMDAFVLPSLYEGKPFVGIETQTAALKSYLSDTITKTLKFTEYIEYIKLDSTPNEWANEILTNGANYKRINMREIVKENGYDIKEVTKNIENIYINLMKVEQI